jgi:hypothetical protein
VSEGFDILTGQPRAGTARLVTAVLEALDVTVEEVPGGLPMMQQLIAASHGAVGTLLLPFALDSLKTEDDVIELCTTIAAKGEKKHKVVLVAALGSDALISRVGRGAALAGIEILRADRTDATFAAKVDAVAGRLGALPIPDRPPRPFTTGLWGRKPKAPRTRPGTPFRHHYGYDGLLSPSYPYAQTSPRPGSCDPAALELYVLCCLPMRAPEYDVLLRQCVNTVYDVEEFGQRAARCLVWLIGLEAFSPTLLRRAALDRLAAGTLGLARLSSVLELAVEAGGLRAMWPVLLDVADAAASMTPKPAGLPELLRLLTGLVNEVPEPHVPMAVAALATSGPASKSRAEAQRYARAVAERS